MKNKLNQRQYHPYRLEFPSGNFRAVQNVESFDIYLLSNLTGDFNFLGKISTEGLSVSNLSLDTLTGHLDLNGSMNINGPLSVTGDFTVNGNTNFSGNINYDGLSLNSLRTKKITGATSLSGSFDIFGPVSLTGDFSVQGDANLESLAVQNPMSQLSVENLNVNNLDVTGESNFYSPVTFYSGVYGFDINIDSTTGDFEIGQNLIIGQTGFALKEFYTSGLHTTNLYISGSYFDPRRYYDLMAEVYQPTEDLQHDSIINVVQIPNRILIKNLSLSIWKKESPYVNPNVVLFVNGTGVWSGELWTSSFDSGAYQEVTGLNILVPKGGKISSKVMMAQTSGPYLASGLTLLFNYIKL